MPVNVYTDFDGRRVIVRNVGPPGIGIPEGGTTGQILVKSSSDPYETTWANAPDGTGAVVGPASAVNGNIALFDGITGKLIKDSGHAESYFATKSYADTKVTIDGDKVLSDNNFSDADKIKLDALSSGGFRGSYTTEDDIEDIVSPQQGDRAYLEVEDEDVVEYLWDSTNELWYPQSLNPLAMTGAEIADVLFDDDEVWVKDDCIIFTPALKETLEQTAATVEAALGGGSGYQAQDATLTAFAGVTSVADRIAYFTGVDTMSTVDFTAAGRALVAGNTIGDQRTTLGIGITDLPQFAGIAVTSGSTARAGNVTLVAGVATVNNTALTANDVIILTRMIPGGTMGAGGVKYVVNPGVSFVITAVDLAGATVTTDTSTISYFIVRTI